MRNFTSLLRSISFPAQTNLRQSAERHLINFKHKKKKKKKKKKTSSALLYLKISKETTVQVIVFMSKFLHIALKSFCSVERGAITLPQGNREINKNNVLAAIKKGAPLHCAIP